jgi:hypothetical protein
MKWILRPRWTLRRMRLATPLSFGFSARPNKNSDFKEYCFQMV